MQTPSAIVTGASRGIGRETVRFLVEGGFDVLATARSAEPLQQLAVEAERRGGRVVPLPLDLAEASSCLRIVEGARHAFGRIDALVNNAAMLDPIGHLADVELDEFEQSMSASFFAVVALTRHALSDLRETKGRIVNITSTTVGSPAVGMSAYSCGKAAMEQLATVVAAEEPDVTVVTAIPGLVDTRMQEKLSAQDARAMSQERVEYFRKLAQDGELLDPAVPAKSIATIARAAPPEWSGRRVRFDAPEVQQLSARARP